MQRSQRLPILKRVDNMLQEANYRGLVTIIITSNRGAITDIKSSNLNIVNVAKDDLSLATIRGKSVCGIITDRKVGKEMIAAFKAASNTMKSKDFPVFFDTSDSEDITLLEQAGIPTSISDDKYNRFVKAHRSKT